MNTQLLYAFMAASGIVGILVCFRALNLLKTLCEWLHDDEKVLQPVTIETHQPKDMINDSSKDSMAR